MEDRIRELRIFLAQALVQESDIDSKVDVLLQITRQLLPEIEPLQPSLHELEKRLERIELLLFALASKSHPEAAASAQRLYAQHVESEARRELEQSPPGYSEHA